MTGRAKKCGMPACKRTPTAHREWDIVRLEDGGTQHIRSTAASRGPRGQCFTTESRGEHVNISLGFSLFQLLHNCPLCGGTG